MNAPSLLVSRKLKNRDKSIHFLVKNGIKDYIIQNSLHAGDILPSEADIAVTLGVSRTSVREAVKSLEILGIIHARPGIGLMVDHFSFNGLVDRMNFLTFDRNDEILEAAEIKLAIELEVAGQLMTHASAEQMDRLSSTLDLILNDAYLGRTKVANHQLFYRTLWTRISNSTIRVLLDVLYLYISHACLHALSKESYQTINSNAFYCSLYDALARNDVAGAQNSFRSYFDLLSDAFKSPAYVGRTKACRR